MNPQKSLVSQSLFTTLAINTVKITVVITDLILDVFFTKENVFPFTVLKLLLITCYLVDTLVFLFQEKFAP